MTGQKIFDKYMQLQKRSSKTIAEVNEQRSKIKETKFTAAPIKSAMSTGESSKPPKTLNFRGMCDVRSYSKSEED